jgi:hypothetical protein
MSDAKKSKTGNEDEISLLRSVERCNLILVVLLTGESWIRYGWPFAQSVLIGGILVSSSFFWQKRNTIRFIQHAEVLGSDGQISGKSFTVGFTIKFVTRLFVLGFLLLLICSKFSINAIGLIIGLSTVMLSVIIVGLVRGLMIFQKNL